MGAYIGSELKGTNPTSIDINEYFSVTSMPANENIKITTVGTGSRIQIPASNILSGQTIILTVKKTFPTNFIQILLGVWNNYPGGDEPNTCKIQIDDQVEIYSNFAHPQIGSPVISNLTPIFLAPKTNIVITLLKDYNNGVPRLIGLTGYDNNGIAHNISKAYIGVPTEKTKDVPRQETTTTTKTISCTVNDANTASQYKKLSDLFTITNGSSYYFANDNTESTNNYSTYKSNNGGQDSTTASTTLTALHDFSALSFGYSYSGESNYDYVTLIVGGTTVESKASGSTTNKTWSGTLSKGQTIKITFTKDTSYDRYDDCGTIYNIQATYQATVTETITVIDKVGTGEYANLARRVKAIYIGDPFTEIARFVFAKAPEYIIDTDTSSTDLTQNRLATLAAPASGNIDVENAAKIKYYYGTTIKSMDNDALQYCTSLAYLVLPVLDTFPRPIGIDSLNCSLFLPKCDQINTSNFSGKILYAPRAFAATGLPDQSGLGPTSIVYLPSATTCLLHSQVYSAIYFDVAAKNVLSNNELSFPKIKTLVLRASDVCSLGSTKILENSLIATGEGYIYVPDNLVNSYKTATNWSTYANQIKPLSELPPIETFIKELKP